MCKNETEEKKKKDKKSMYAKQFTFCSRYNNERWKQTDRGNEAAKNQKNQNRKKRTNQKKKTHAVFVTSQQRTKKEEEAHIYNWIFGKKNEVWPLAKSQ
jgi:hypothetical protein